MYDTLVSYTIHCILHALLYTVYYTVYTTPLALYYESARAAPPLETFCLSCKYLLRGGEVGCELGSRSVFPLFQIASELGDLRDVRTAGSRDGLDSVQVQEEEKHSRGTFCCNTSVSPPLLRYSVDFIGFLFFQELEKIETELTSLGKLKTETLVWQKKVFKKHNRLFKCNMYGD